MQIELAPYSLNQTPNFEVVHHNALFDRASIIDATNIFIIEKEDYYNDKPKNIILFKKEQSQLTIKDFEFQDKKENVIEKV